jgi:exopolysaccharide transport family protein
MQKKTEPIDIRDYLHVVLKRKWTIATFFTITVLTVAVYSFTATPSYRTSTRIVIETENPNLVSIQEVLSVDATRSDYYQTQYKIIESRNVAREVIRRLQLDKVPEFVPFTRAASLIKGWGVLNILDSMINRIKDLMPESEHADAAKDENENIDSELVNEFIKRIGVNPIRNSRLVDISMSSEDPQLAARMANVLVRTYIDRNMETKLQAAKDAVKWLGDRINEERKKVGASENALLRYKENNEIITDFTGDSENITAQKLATLNAQTAEAESQRVTLQTRYNQAAALSKKPGMLNSIPDVLSNDLIKEIKKMEVVLYKRMSELKKKYGRNHPQMVALDSELADIRKRKSIEIRSIINSLKNEYNLADAKEKSLKNALARQKTETLSLNKKAVQYGVLKRQAESSRQMYDLLIRRFKETSLTEEMKIGNIRIIDRAETPTKPVKPRRKLNILLSMIIGLTAGIFIAFFLEYLDNTIKAPDDVKKHLGIPFLGPVPMFASTNKNSALPDVVAVYSPKAVASESFRGIRTGILYSSADNTPQTILVTSAGPGEGKTSCASNLAAVMAQSGGRILLLDCDMRRPKLHRMFGINPKMGLSGVLVKVNQLKDTIQPTGVENLDIIPCGPTPPNPSELLGSDQMRLLLDRLRKRYTRIIIDSSPVTAVTDSVILAKEADAVVLIVRAGETPRPSVKAALDQLAAVEANIIGAVLNSVQAERDGYHHYQYYYYYYGSTRDKRDERQKKQTQQIDISEKRMAERAKQQEILTKKKKPASKPQMNPKKMKKTIRNLELARLKRPRLR